MTRQKKGNAVVDANNTHIGTVNPSEIKHPIQLLAVVLGVIVVALIIVTVYLSSIQVLLGWFTIFMAVAITFYISHEFISILKNSPGVFYPPNIFNPGDFILMLKMLKQNEDYVEDQSLYLAEAKEKTEEIIEKFVPKSELGKVEYDETIKLIKNDLVKAHLDISSSEMEKEGYFNLGSGFEDLVTQCLIELKIPIKIQPLQQTIRPDFVAIKITNGKTIPIETKFYRKRVIANELTSKLVKQMKRYMNLMNTDESILIISSEVTPDALKRFNELSGKEKIHIVTGNTKEELKSQLVNILT